MGTHVTYTSSLNVTLTSITCPSVYAPFAVVDVTFVAVDDAVSTMILSLKSDQVFHNLSTHLIYTVLGQSPPDNTRHAIVVVQVCWFVVGLALFPIYIPLNPTHHTSVGHHVGRVKVTVDEFVCVAQALMLNVVAVGGVAS